MDQYIRDFNVTTIETYSLEDVHEARMVLNVNKNSSNFKLLNCNIRSISKNFDEFKIYLHQLNSDIDCIILTETWMIHCTDVFQLDGYCLIYNEGTYNQNDGVIIYIKNCYTYNYRIFNVNLNNVIKLNIIADKNIEISAIYRSPSMNTYEFNIHLRNYIEQNCNGGDYNFIVGDLNIDILQHNEYISEYLNILSEFGYVSTINEYTRIQGESKSCIDHIFLKHNKHVHNNILPIIIKTDITDHFITALQVVLDTKQVIANKSKTVTHINYKKLHRIIKNCSWESVYTTEDTDAATDNFLKLLKDKVNECTYYRKIKVKKKNWITNALLTSIDKKNKMYKNTLKYPENEQLKNEYKRYKNILEKLIKKTKADYYKQQINKNLNNTKQLWNVVNELTGKTHNENLTSLTTETGDITDKKEMANLFNSRFVNIGSELASKIKSTQYNNNDRIISQNSLFLAPTNPLEIVHIILQLKNNKSAGIDHLKSEILKAVVDDIAEPLSYIFNNAIEKGHFPSQFKTSIIIPLHKSGDKNTIGNYRPISLITAICKIFEKVIKIRLTEYLNKYKLISDNQYGFRQNISTEDAILNLTSKIYSALDKADHCLCIFIDLAKAFDTVSHSLLLQSLEDIGVRNNCLKLFKSYLSDRKQCVRVGYDVSGYEVIKYGVPQGTVLGPILFTIYVNGLFSLNSEGDVISFADDTAIFYKSNTWQDLKETVEKDMANIKNWFDYKLLTINFDKTLYIPFTCNKSVQPTFNEINIQNEKTNFRILPSTKVKYLGIVIDQHLKWDLHILFLIKKLRFILYKFKFFVDFLDSKQLLIIYYSLVQSHLIYGIAGWGGVAKTHLMNLEILQKKFLKMILKKSNTYPSDMLFSESKIMDIRQLFFYRLIIKQNANKSSLLQINHQYDTRKHNQIFMLPFMKKTIGQRSYNFLASKCFSILPKQLVYERNINVFKKLLKKFIVEKPRCFIHSLFDQN